jgi:hypothetical protein
MIIIFFAVYNVKNILIFRDHTNQRDDMTKPLDFYHTRGMQRTSQNLKEDVVKNYNVLLVV